MRAKRGHSPQVLQEAYAGRLERRLLRSQVFSLDLRRSDVLDARNDVADVFERRSGSRDADVVRDGRRRGRVGREDRKPRDRASDVPQRGPRDALGGRAVRRKRVALDIDADYEDGQERAQR